VAERSEEELVADAAAAGGGRQAAADLLVTDPLETLQHVLEREVRRADRRRLELAEIRNALLQLGMRQDRPGGEEEPSVWEPLVADVAPTMVERLLETTEGTIRHCVVSLDAGPGTEEDIRDLAVARMGQGRQQRGIYPLNAWQHPESRRLIEVFGHAGEVQRVTPETVSDFAIFGDTAVMAVATWGDAGANYVLIRHPMLVRLFIEFFEKLFALALPVPASGREVDPDLELLSLLGSGLKDEAIARYLGCSLRTVRRRVAQLMDRFGADTRFQLGVAVAESGALRPPRQAQRPRPRVG
jgi:DNA-binding CsgD family transcriptional regulator